MASPRALALTALLTACGRSSVDAFVAGGGGGAGDHADTDGDDRGDWDGRGEHDDRGDEGADEGAHDSVGGSPNPCRKVDFLFVVDNSESMGDNQAKLAANYGVIVDGIRETVRSVEDVHVGVVTTDVYEHNAPSCRSLGGLVTATGGIASSRRYCGPFASGGAYMNGDDDLDVAFPCAARVGIEGSGSERPLAAAIGALSYPLVGRGECNEGFLRDDALLVLVIVTDEDARMDPLDAAISIDERKPGGARDVVVVVLANGSDGECPPRGSSRTARRLEDFVDYFPYGFVGPICAPSFGEVFERAVDVAGQACDGA